MGHQIFAIVGPCEVLRELPRVTEPHLSFPLEQGYCAVAATETLLDHLDSVFPRASVRAAAPGFVHLRGGLVELLEALSRRAPVAYIETDFFGGAGRQSAAAFVDGEAVYSVGGSKHRPISKALRTIGVKRRRAGDEFDALGLGGLRNMDAFKLA